METVTRLCDQAILLEHGRIAKMGPPNEVTNAYFDLLFGTGGRPKLIKTVGNYNVLNCLGTYYAVPHALGNIDVGIADLSGLDGVITGNNIEEVETLIGKGLSMATIAAGAVHDQRSDLEVFLDDVPTIDNCTNRRSYNKNESRTGDGRAEIVDYVCVRDHDFDVLEVKTWDSLQIYMKILFRQEFQWPVYGVSIKSVEGVKVYGTNTWLDKIDVLPTSGGAVVNFCCQVKVSLTGGDFFLTLAIANRVNHQNVLADHRADLIHIRVQPDKDGRDGIVEMDSKSEIISQTAMTKKWISV